MNLFAEDTICIDLQAKTREDVIDQMVTMLDEAGVLSDKELYKQCIWAREKLSTTEIGFDIAIPHAKTKAVKETRVAFGIVKEGVDYKSEDESLAHLIFMIAAGDGADNLHLQVLSRLARKLIDPVFRDQLLKAKDKKSVMEYLSEV
ncbi:PTS system fructose-specific IIC component [Sporomusaceae bacterium BoRhaA]|uniref:PTS sugar transporter subunit IIA n=1 Tax=Pelorhabdus rhamnosifermentans TaxID=2772457 RepID=UPI001C063D92|nr:fructose PTS transporter subunit IIA [Pelorhabdus rhamnosifermentans]MBU2699739.1 PTS system fructose-specific IIC component [Pelorhabdus rhamnosifermentans]